MEIPSGEGEILSSSAESDKNEGEDMYIEPKPGDDWFPQVVSEVNIFLVLASDIKPLRKPTNRVARLLFSLPGPVEASSDEKSKGKTSPAAAEMQFDKDGDLILPPRGNMVEELSLFIEFEGATSMEQVGLQIWRGALLLADFIIHSAETFFRNKTILEFGSGTGLSSVVAGIYAKKVIATDLDEDNGSILKLIEANVTHNKNHVRSEFLVKALDFRNLSWSEDLEKSIADADVLLAADVVYHEKITEAFIRTLQKCLLTGAGKEKNVFIAVEKRYVFTVTDLDVVAPMYEAFLEQLKSILGLSRNSSSTSPEASSTAQEGSEKVEYGPITPARTRLSIRPIHIDFPQYFNYERNDELVLWHIKSEICSN